MEHELSDLSKKDRNLIEVDGKKQEEPGFMEKAKFSIGPMSVKSFYEENDGDKSSGTLTNSGAVLGLVSTILGGGMVSIPFSLYSMGLYPGTAIILFAAIQTTGACVLLLKAREVCPNNPSSFFEIGYLVLGRASIFIICFFLYVNSFLLNAIYINVFSNVCVNVMKALFWYNCEDNWGTWKGTYAITIGILLVPTTLMKEIAELHLLSMCLFGSALLFIAINVL